jgi:hypothetical protein
MGCGAAKKAFFAGHLSFASLFVMLTMIPETFAACHSV